MNTSTTSHINFSAGIELQARRATGPAVSMTTYSGGLLRVAGFDRPVLVALDGLEIDTETPLCLDHSTRTDDLLGVMQARTEGGKLFAEGALNNAAKARQIVELWRLGQKLQASVGCAIVESRDIPAGESVTVNGRTHTAPPGGLLLARKSQLREISIVGVGADERSTVRIAAALAAMNGDTDMSEHDETQATTEPTNTGDAPERKAVLVSGTRAGEVIDKCNAHLPALQAAGKLDVAKLAIREQWDDAKLDRELQDAELRMIRGSRSPAPAVAGSKPEPQTRDVMAAALLLSAGEHATAEKTYPAEVMNRASDLHARNGLDVVRAGLRLIRGDAPTEREELVNAAFSTTELGSAVADSSRAALLSGYVQSPQNHYMISRRIPVNNFQEHTAVRPYVADSLLAEVGKDGELKHTKLGETGYDFKISTFGRIIGITRQDVIDDAGLGRIFELERAVGLAAGRTLNKAVWARLRDAGGAHFSEDNGNLISGADSALSLTGFGLAIAALRAQTDDGGEPTGLEPAVLAVPPALESTARALLNSTEIGRSDEEPNANPWRAIAELAVVPHLAASHGGSDSRWYLAASPASCAGLIVGLLGGQDSPTVERLQPEARYLGMQLRAYFDFGTALGDPVAIVRSAGV